MFSEDHERAGPKKMTKAMRGARPMGRGTLALAIAVTLALGVIGGSALGVLLRAPVTAPAVPGTDYLFLTIGFDFATGLDRYMPSNFSVPTHTEIQVTITNYDNASNPVSSAVAAVSGTLGGVEVMRSASATEGMAMTAVPANDVAHTFTMDGGAYSMNVPIPAASSLGNPMIVTFRAYFNVTGQFTWHCMAPCDPSSMKTPGYMQGTVTVVDA